MNAETMKLPPGQMLDLPAMESGEEQVETTREHTIFQIVGPSDPTPGQVLRLIELSEALDFWEAPEENLYSREDGEPI